jgi:hypothetical protein
MNGAFYWRVMNAAHVHLILNHFPIAGLLFSMALLTVAWRLRNETLKVVALAAVVATGLVTVAVFLSGDEAADVVKKLSNISDTAIKNHEEAAEKSAWAVWITSLVALGALVLAYLKKALPKWAVGVVLALCALSTGLMGFSNNLGGQISHPELRGK